jgi:hypothetical protein
LVSSACDVLTKPGRRISGHLCGEDAVTTCFLGPTQRGIDAAVSSLKVSTPFHRTMPIENV